MNESVKSQIINLFSNMIFALREADFNNGNVGCEVDEGSELSKKMIHAFEEEYKDIYRKICTQSQFKCVKDIRKRVGRFFINTDYLDYNSNYDLDMLYKMFNNMIILRVESVSNHICEYLACSESFREISTNEKPPTYDIVITGKYLDCFGYKIHNIEYIERKDAGEFPVGSVLNIVGEWKIVADNNKLLDADGTYFDGKEYPELFKLLKSMDLLPNYLPSKLGKNDIDNINSFLDRNNE